MQAGLQRLAEHPGKGHQSQPRVLRRIATADIGVHAGEPHLQHVGLAVLLAEPEVLPEEAAAFVDGQGLADHVDHFVVRGIRHGQRVVDPAHRGHGVEQAEEMHLHLPAEDLAEASQQAEVRSAATRAGPLVFVAGRHAGGEQGPGVVEEVRLVRIDQAHRAQHRGQHAHRVGPAGKAEEEYLVAGPVVLGEEAIGALDVALEPPAEGQAGDPRGKLLPLEQGFLQAEGADALVVVGQHPARIARQRAVQAHHVGRLVAEAVRGSVDADHQLARRVVVLGAAGRRQGGIGERSSIGLTQAKPDFRRRWMGMATHDTQPG